MLTNVLTQDYLLQEADSYIWYWAQRLQKLSKLQLGIRETKV
jgi:hypothetical protein